MKSVEKFDLLDMERFLKQKQLLNAQLKHRARIEQYLREGRPVSGGLRQYYTGPMGDSLVTPITAVSPGITTTSIFSIAQANKYFALPYGQNAPSPGQVLQVTAGGLLTTPSSGTLIILAYHGPGTTATAFGTLIGTSTTFTPTASMTAGYWQLTGTLIYRTVSEIATTSTCWFNGQFICGGPSGGSLAFTSCMISSNAAVSVDTTGSGSAGTFGALNFAVTPSITGSSFTPEFAFIEVLN